MPRRTNIYLSELQLKRLKRLGEKRDVSVSELVRRAVDQFLDQEETRKRLTGGPIGTAGR